MLPGFTVCLMVQYNVIILILVDIYTVYLIILSNLGFVGLGWVTPVKKIMGWVHLLLGWDRLGQKYGPMSNFDPAIWTLLTPKIRPSLGLSPKMGENLSEMWPNRHVKFHADR